MISSKQELKEYIEKDRFALGVNKKFPALFGDEIWKFEIALRKHEYYENCKGPFWCKLFWKYIHHTLGRKLGFSIPCNVFGGGFGLITMV